MVWSHNQEVSVLKLGTFFYLSVHFDAISDRIIQFNRCGDARVAPNSYFATHSRDGSGLASLWLPHHDRCSSTVGGWVCVSAVLNVVHWKSFVNLISDGERALSSSRPLSAPSRFFSHWHTLHTFVTHCRSGPRCKPNICRVDSAIIHRDFFIDVHLCGAFAWAGSLLIFFSRQSNCWT